jgi:sugar phosphate isomerase/epimerase
MKADPVQVCRDHDVIGCKYIGLGSLPGAHEVTEESYQAFVNEIRPIAETFAKEGHKLFYHNHHYEFMRSDNGKLYMERMMEDFAPELFGFTLDMYWVQAGGANPMEWMERLKGRIECIHLKDMKIVGKEQRMAPVGEGNINFAKIVEAAADLGVEHMLVEQDNSYTEDPFDCLRRSYLYLKANGFE